MKKISTVFVSLILCASIHAQDTTNVTVVVADSQDFADSSSIIKNYNTQLDSLVNLWYVQKAGGISFSKTSKKHYDSTYVPTFSPKEYKLRIEKMNTVVPISYNAKVQSYIDVYAMKRRNSVSSMLGLADYYFPIFDDIFDQYDVPHELKYLSIIESALNPKAKSPAGARGIWQFMPSTGKNYDLAINSYLDERCDPVKSTHAAARYLKDLYNIFNDWILAIAAYNCGPGNVKKAIARSNGKTNFWDIYPYLPNETRGYVPAYIAAYYVFEHHEIHNLFPRKITMPKVDTIMVTKKLHFKQIAEVLEVPLKEIEDINPQYKADIVPTSENGSPLYLPHEFVSPFIRLQDSIYAYKDSLYLNIQPEKAIVSSDYGTGTAGKTKQYYTVRSGDNLGKIAKKYGVSVNTLKSWNHKKSNMIHVGDKLIVYAKSAGKGSSAQKATQTTKNYISQSNTSQKNNTNVNKKVHVVRAGDTLWNISQTYGVTVDEIKRLNGLNSSKLSIGMNLRIH